MFCMTNKIQKYKKRTLQTISVLLLLLLMIPCVTCFAEAEGPKPSLDELNTGKIGVVTGSAYEQFAKDTFKEAEIKYFTGGSEMIMGLQQNKIDAFLADSLWYAAMCWDLDTLKRYDDNISSLDCAFALSDEALKSGLLDQVNAFITESKKNGLLDKLNKKWIGDVEPQECPDLTKLPNVNGKIKVAVSAYSRPLAYMKDNRAYGMNVELLYAFAEEYGYATDVDIIGFEAILPGIAAGKYDIAASQIAITEERKQVLNFSDPYIKNEVIAVYYQDAKQAGNFFGKLMNSLELTFIKEQRWLMILNGIKITMIITLCALILGLALGFGLYMLRRKFGKPIINFMKVYTRILSGTPMVVILMILYYIIFASGNISGTIVAIVGFSLTCCSFVYSNLTIAVDSVSPGQREAALASGFTENSTFFNVVLPQAMKIFLPAFQGEAVALCKSTAIVGYVTVQDLTKATDIIRGNTYEAFFPLITTAIIYFLLTWAIAGVIGTAISKADTKRRTKKEILKGVKNDD